MANNYFCRWNVFLLRYQRLYTSVHGSKVSSYNKFKRIKEVFNQSNFILSTYRVLISIDGAYQLDLRGTEFGDLIGFEKKIVTKTEYGTKLPNITNSIDVLNINTSAITDSIVNGINTNTIAVIPTDNLTRSHPFKFEPKRPLYCSVSTFHIDEMRIYVTDSLGRPVNFNSIDWYMSLILHSM